LHEDDIADIEELIENAKKKKSPGLR